MRLQTQRSMKRCDTRALFAALDRKREEQGLTWQQVAKAIGWLGRPVEDFVRNLRG